MMNETPLPALLLRGNKSPRSVRSHARDVVDLDSKRFLSIWRTVLFRKTNGTFARIQVETETHRSRDRQARESRLVFHSPGGNRVLKAETRGTWPDEPANSMLSDEISTISHEIHSRSLTRRTLRDIIDSLGDVGDLICTHFKQNKRVDRYRNIQLSMRGRNWKNIPSSNVTAAIRLSIPIIYVRPHEWNYRSF